MAASLIQILLTALAVYGVTGIVFAVVFQVSGAMSRLDPVVRASTQAFRVLCIPGLAALWPVMAGRWFARRRGS